MKADILRAATELLEAIAENRALLADVPVHERTRLLQAAGRISRPDAIDRRRLLKITKRRRKAERLQRDEEILAKTGIRTLRRQPAFTTPNVYPPVGFIQQEIEGDQGFREIVEP